jgi:hypothetical protein
LYTEALLPPVRLDNVKRLSPEATGPRIEELSDAEIERLNQVKEREARCVPCRVAVSVFFSHDRRLRRETARRGPGGAMSGALIGSSAAPYRTSRRSLMAGMPDSGLRGTLSFLHVLLFCKIDGGKRV